MRVSAHCRIFGLAVLAVCWSLPAAQLPLRRYTTADGLANNAVYSIASDSRGFLWFGTGEGLSRFDGFGFANQTRGTGLPHRLVRQVLIGRHGNYWLATPASYGSGPDPTHNSGSTATQTDFPASMCKASRKTATARSTSEPEAELTGWIRIWRTSGTIPPPMASLQERGMPRIATAPAPPLWQRAWFQGILIATAMAAAFWVHRARVAKLLAIERVRIRIATDLHDDIGSSLSQIAILSEVAHQRSAGSKAGEPIERIGALSRELLDYIGDIVWAIQPHKDHLSDLKQRMRRFAADVLSARNVEMHWSVSDSGRDLELDTELRRQVYLIFKESINNIARHSQATEAHIALRVVDRQLALEISDNGCGLESGGHHDGNGLESMKLRAARLGGELGVNSSVGQGTTVLLRAPLPM